MHYTGLNRSAEHLIMNYVGNLYSSWTFHMLCPKATTNCGGHILEYKYILWQRGFFSHYRYSNNQYLQYNNHNLQAFYNIFSKNKLQRDNIFQMPFS